MLQLIWYTVLFVFFMMLIKRSEKKLGNLHRQVIAFFTVMLVVLVLNFVLDLMFYLKESIAKEVDGDDGRVE